METKYDTDTDRYINIPYGQSSAKLPVTRSHGHSFTQSLGHLVTRPLGHLVIWSLSHSVTRSLGQPLGHSVTQSLGRSLGHSVQVCFADNNIYWYIFDICRRVQRVRVLPGLVLLSGPRQAGVSTSTVSPAAMWAVATSSRPHRGSCSTRYLAGVLGWAGVLG